MLGGKFLENDESSFQAARFLHDRGGEKTGVGAPREFILAVEMSCARRATHHQRARMHEARPQAANEARQPPDSGARADEQVQIEDEKRLDAADLALPVPYCEIPIIVLRV